MADRGCTKTRWLSWRRRALAAGLCAACLFDVTGASAEKRLALLISNQTYVEAVGPLQNPRNDIALIKAALLRVGFPEDDIQVIAEAGRVAMLAAFDAFAAKVRGAGTDAISFFYYSGHGAANDRRENFLIPVDVQEVTAASFYNAVSLRELLDRLNAEAPEAKHFVVFDACRNTLKLRAPGTRVLMQPRGFEPVRNIPGGMLIAFSTAEGELASDAGERAGPYATVLAEEIVRPGVEAVTVFRNAQLRVSGRMTQRPWTQNGPIGETYFAARETPQSEAAQAWQWVQNMQSEAVLEEFIGRFGDSPEAGLARAKFAELRRQGLTIRIPVTICERPSVWVSLKGPAGKCLKPGSGETFRDCWKDGAQEVCGAEMAVVPEGEFFMGSPKGEAGRYEEEDDKAGDGGEPVRVKIGKPFAVGKFEVTFHEWEACVKGGGCQSNKTPNDHGWGTGKRPVIDVSWKDAQEYVAWINAKIGGNPYRLPSEAEWEYAARSGEAKTYSWRGGKGNANCNSCGSQWDDKQTAPAGSFKPNKWGLYDMHGNVWEWVQDCYADSYKDTPRDGGAAEPAGDCGDRVLRGGSWLNSPQNLRSADRNRGLPSIRYNVFGFRVARTITP